MKLYYSRGACSLAVRIIINEIGLTSEYEAVDLKTKQTETGSDFLKINPKGVVPTFITDEGETLTEVSVILQYLADSAHAAQLMPPPPHFNHYRVLEWLNYVATELHKSIGPLFRTTFTEEMKQSIFVPMIKTKLKFVDNHLHRHKFLVDEHFTLPDAYLFVILRWAMMLKFDLAKWPYVYRYFAELLNRPSIQKSMQEEGLS